MIECFAMDHCKVVIPVVFCLLTVELVQCHQTCVVVRPQCMGEETQVIHQAVMLDLHQHTDLHKVVGILINGRSFQVVSFQMLWNASVGVIDNKSYHLVLDRK